MRYLFGAILMFGLTANADWILQRSRLGVVVKPISAIQVDQLAAHGTTVGGIELRSTQAKLLKSLPMYLSEDTKPSAEVYEEVYWPHEVLPGEYQNLRLLNQEVVAQGTEVRKILDQGPDRNRICLTFLGDGYTESEKQKFFDDVQRLFDDIAQGNTFASYRSLFNVYAVFVPSQQSGISDNISKRTAFGLYRSPAGSKRAIMPGNTSAIERAIAMAPKTDFPIVIANDDFYGGLGGRYAITTRSAQSGKIVLRHELGHNFGAVGEEYDNGQVYSGANSSRSATNLPWKHWLSSNTKKVSNEMLLLTGAYVWKNLSTGSVVQDFNIPANHRDGPYWFDMVISSVGWETPQDVQVLLDGKPLTLDGIWTSDRSFFRFPPVQNLSAGPHRLEIKEQIKDGNNVLAFATLFGYEPNYDFSGNIGAFSTYDESGSVSYRPTHSQCLMRDMLYEHFCSVDQENMWLRFLGRINLIDDLVVGSNSVQLKALSLSGLQVKWYQNSSTGWTEISQFANQLEIPKSQFSTGRYRVEAIFRTSEIRKMDPKLSVAREFQI